MNRASSFVLFAAAAIVIGALLLKGFAGEGPNNPVASVKNADPRGLLALWRFLKQSGVEVKLREHHRDAFAPGLLIIPPPELAHWSKPEVAELLAAVKAGTIDLLLLCDDEKARNRRLSTFRDQVGIGCDDRPPPLQGTWLGQPQLTLETRAGGGLSLETKTPAAVMAQDGEHHLWVARSLGAGTVHAIASVSALTNDGLGQADNAETILRLARGRVVTIDEAHHHVRRVEVLAEAFARPGPKSGLVALLLLLPFSLLALWPRPGDAPPPQITAAAPAAEVAAQALASLYRQAKVKAKAPGGETTVAAPPARGRDG